MGLIFLGFVFVCIDLIWVLLICWFKSADWFLGGCGFAVCLGCLGWACLFLFGFAIVVFGWLWVVGFGELWVLVFLGLVRYRCLSL